jgi:hypothetical protein
MDKDSSNLILLSFFVRACQKKIKNENGDVVDTYRREWVKCRIWLKDANDLKDFMRIHQPIKWGPELFDNMDDFTAANQEKETIETKWVPYHTLTAKELGIKE